MPYCKPDSATTAKMYSYRQLKLDNPRIGFPPESNMDEARWNEYGAFTFTEADRPTPDPATHKVTGKSIELVGGEWTQVWTVEEKTQAEKDAYADSVANESDATALKQDNQVRALLKARPAQINTYIDNNVKDLASAKGVLKILARALAVLAQDRLD